MISSRDWRYTTLGTMLRCAIVFTLLSGVSAFVGADAQQPATQSASTPLVFDGVTVIDVQDGKRIPAQRVVVVGTRIKIVGKASSVFIPSGAKVVDARGKYLIPGLWDVHTHSRRSTDIFYPLFIANGVTGIRDAGSEVPLDTLRLWRREILAGTRVGPPRQVLSGPSITDEDTHCNREERRKTNRLQTCVADSADARHLVDSLKAAGADMIKPRAVKKAMYYVIGAESRRIGIPFGGHTDDGQLPMDVSDSGASIVDHLQIIKGDLGLYGLCWGSQASASIAQCQPIANRFKRNGTWLVPTLARYYDASYTNIVSDEVRDGFMRQPPNIIYKRFMTRAKEFWTGSLLHGNWLRDSTGTDNTTTNNATGAAPHDTLGNMRIMMRTGLPILAGTDVGAPVMETMPPGFSLLTELAMYVDEGLTPLEALRSATLNPAKFLHATDSLGTVTQGKLADLVLLDADPLADITNLTAIRSVVANGRYFDRMDLDKLLTDAQEARKRDEGRK